VEHERTSRGTGHRIVVRDRRGRGPGAGGGRRTADGVRIVVDSARSTATGEALADELPDAVHVRGDVADPADARRIVAAAIEAYGRLDILVDNAGTTRFTPLGDLDAADAAAWRDIFDVNVFGVWQLTTAAVPHLSRSQSAAIVNISSTNGRRRRAHAARRTLARRQLHV
jgi:ketoreductase RED2